MRSETRVVARLGLCALGLALALWRCGDEEGSPGPGGGENGSSAASGCGAPGEPLASECLSLAECGLGVENAEAVRFCDLCPLRAQTEVCLGGRCEPFALTGSIEVAVTAFPDEATGARSVVLAALEPIAADGTRLTCAGLLGPTCRLTGNPELNATNVRFVNLAAPAEPGTVVPGLRTVAVPGPDKLLLLRATSEVQGRGQVLAEGCREGIIVPEADTVVLDVLTLEPT